MGGVKQKVKDLRSLVIGCLYELAWRTSRNRKNKNCLNHQARNEQLVVSLTSFPDRIGIVHKTVRSILNQERIKPDKVELWLASEQFKNGERDLPTALLDLKKYGLEIRWYHDIRSFKKLIPTLKEHSDSIIVTADDDVFYERDWLTRLFCGYEQNKHNIYCHKATKFYLDEDGNYRATGGGKYYYKEGSFLNKLVGVGGVLYPPGSLNTEVLNEVVFQELAPTNDDIWFWFMAILNKTKVSVVAGNTPKPIEIYERRKSGKLTNINDSGENLFWVQFNNLINRYPEVDSMLRNEFLLTAKFNREQENGFRL